MCLIDSKPRELDEEDKLLLKDIAVMVEQEIAAMQLATMDELTMISNRRGFTMLAQHALALCKRHEIDAAMLVFDLNKFKPINDTFGHAEGDRALTAFAQLLKMSFRDSDVYARTGGDEFSVLITNVEELKVETALERFADEVAKHNEKAARGYNLEYSVGVAKYEHGESLEELMDKADRAMYADKKEKSR